MKRNTNDFIRASALRIVLSTALISLSAILLAMAAPNNAKKAPRQVTATGQSSGIPAPAIFTAATPAPTPGPCDKIAFDSNRDGNDEIYVMNADGTGQTRLTNNPAL